MHYLSWKNALETQNYAWRFTGQYSKAAADKRQAREVAFKRREKQRKELYARMQDKKDAARRKQERKQEIVSDLQGRYGVLKDYFEEFGAVGKVHGLPALHDALQCRVSRVQIGPARQQNWEALG